MKHLDSSSCDEEDEEDFEVNVDESSTLIQRKSSGRVMNI